MRDYLQLMIYKRLYYRHRAKSTLQLQEIVRTRYVGFMHTKCGKTLPNAAEAAATRG